MATFMAVATRLEEWMPKKSPVGALSRLSAPSLGVFRGTEAVEVGVSRNQLTKLLAQGVIERVLPDTYRMTAVPRSNEQELRAALLWPVIER